jgi:hypothetical protein
MYSTSACGLTTNGTLWCWGNGVLGDGTPYSKSTVPVQVNTPGKFIRLSSHGGSSQGANGDCAVKDDHTLWCWGTIGPVSATRPIQMGASAGGGFVDVSVGEERACAITNSGALWCWGTQITMPSQDPISLAGSYSQVAVGFSGTICAVRADGTLWCWKNADVANAIQVPLVCP